MESILAPSIPRPAHQSPLILCPKGSSRNTLLPENATECSAPATLSPMNSRLLALLLWTAVGCKTSDPTPLPTAEAVTQLDRATQPPLYQLLYDDPAVPRARAEHQRVRILIWLRHLGLTEQQLVKLEELHKLSLIHI